MLKKATIGFLVILIIAAFPVQNFAEDNLAADKKTVSSFEELLSACQDVKVTEVVLEKDINDLSEGVLVIGDSKVLDLNGFTIAKPIDKPVDGSMFYNQSRLTIVDTKGTGKIINNSSFPDAACIKNNGTLFLESGNLIAERHNNHCIINEQQFTMNGGRLEALGENSYAIQNKGEMVINGGEIYAKSDAVGIINWQGTIIINDVYLNKADGWPAVINEGVITMNGGKINTTTSGSSCIENYNSQMILDASYETQMHPKFILNGGELNASGKNSHAIVCVDDIGIPILQSGTLSSSDEYVIVKVLWKDRDVSKDEPQYMPGQYKTTEEGVPISIDSSTKLLKLEVRAEIARPTTSNIIIDGEAVTLNAYNINGNNYAQLREFANAMQKMSTKPYGVSYNQALNTVHIATVEPYGEEVGSVMYKKTNVDAFITKQRVFVDEKEVSVTIYNIEGNNYFKLRDLGKLLDFEVVWDNASKTVIIDSAKPYSE